MEHTKNKTILFTCSKHINKKSIFNRRNIMIFGSKGIVDPNVAFDAESEALILEGALMDMGTDELQALLEDTRDVAIAISENIVLEKTIVRLDKTAKLNKARKMAIFAIAKEKNDPKFKKLVTVWKWERFLETFLDKKYGNEALRRAKKTISNNSNSASKLVTTATKKVERTMSTALGGKYSKNNSNAPKAKMNGAIPPGNK